MIKKKSNKRQAMLKSGEWYLDDNGDPRWSATNSHGKRAGTWAARPGGAAPLLSPERAAALNVIKRDQQLIEVENAVVRAANALDGARANSFIEAVGILTEQIAKKAMGGNVAATKLVLQLAEAMPQDRPQATMHIHTQEFRVQIANVYDRDRIQEMVRDAPEYAISLLETADWNEAGDLKSYTKELLSVDPETIIDG